MTAAHPLILGHRGASAGAPENTLAAFALAVSQNADGIELDVRRTADGVMVLHHDADVPDFGEIVAHSFAELRKAAPQVATLDEMLAVCGDLLLDIEIKNDPQDSDHDPNDTVAQAVVRWIHGNDLYGRAFVSSFNWDTMRTVRRLDPEVETGQLLYGTSGIAGLVEDVAKLGHGWVLPADQMLGAEPASQIAAAHRTGLKVMVWTVDHPERINQLASAGIDGIITNDPATALETLDP